MKRQVIQNGIQVFIHLQREYGVCMRLGGGGGKGKNWGKGMVGGGERQCEGTGEGRGRKERVGERGERFWRLDKKASV